MRLRFWQRPKYTYVHDCPHLPGLELRVKTPHGDLLRSDCEALRSIAIMSAFTEIHQADDGGSNWVTLSRIDTADGGYVDLQVRPLIGVYPYGRREPRNTLPDLPS